jgi:endoglucanase Acf2
MVWGGKMDYGTWFSPSSYAKLGIQLLPMTPGSNYLAVDPGRVATNLTNLNDGSAPMFTDVMAMYRSYTNPATAVTEAKALPATSIDDGNSRSWLLAWVYSH